MILFDVSVIYRQFTCFTFCIFCISVSVLPILSVSCHLCSCTTALSEQQFVTTWKCGTCLYLHHEAVSRYTTFEKYHMNVIN